MIPTLRVTDAERRTGRPRAATTACLMRALGTTGVVRLEDLLEPRLVRGVHDGYLRAIASQPGGVTPANATRVGDRRTMFTVEIAGPFARPALLAPPLLLPAFRRLLGDDLVMGSFGVVVAFPGARAQHIHRDAPLLFPERPALSARIPAHALTLVVPLVDLTRDIGPTRVWLRSQRIAEVRPSRLARAGLEPVFAPRGGAFLMDYRIIHGGLPNATGTLRPILYITYARPWFRDPNFVYQQALRVRPETVRKLPPACRALLRLAVPPP